ncbi:hypothetical protein MKW94_024426 [Papaver nudicaule]|uniref:U1 small nuclear ribonucleoprotein C n=1 Tax=Papaver nudicaule TaxID=74823 RepID=A0AA42B3U1_PAPNU|nr:hypothetical protein [Papaver nudicaule]
MPRYYCDYCDTYLTHDSPSVRKQHNSGYKHKANVRTYYQQFEQEQTQSLIDQKIKEHLGQGGYPQVGGIFNQHLASFPPRPRPPSMPIPGMPMYGQMPGGQFPAGMRPPQLPRPAGFPGYGGQPMPMAPPGAPSMPMQMNGLPRPPSMAPPPTVPGGLTPTSNGNPTPPTSGAFDGYDINNAASGLQRPAQDDQS